MEKMSSPGAILKDECRQVKQHLRANIDAKTMKEIVNIQCSIVDDGKMSFNDDFVELNDVDPAHVMMIIQRIPIDQFLEYHNAVDMDLSFSYDRLKDVLKGTKKNDRVSLGFNQDKDVLSVKIGCFSNKIQLLDNEQISHPKMPNLELNAKATIDIKEFYEFLKRADKVRAQYIETATYDNVLYFYAENENNHDNVLLKYPKELLKMLETRDKKVYLSLFSIDYLKEVFGHLKTRYDECTIYFDNDNPLKIRCTNGTETIVLLAPRIDDEDYGHSEGRVKRGYEDEPEC